MLTGLTRLALAAMIAVPVGTLVAAPKAHAQNYYGAITYSEATGSHGYSYDYANQAAAEAAALRECERVSGYGDCSVLVWFRNACGALAKAPDGSYGSGWGTSRAIAEGYALDTCSQYGYGCEVTRWVCTTR